MPSHFSQQSAARLASQARLKEESPSKASLNRRKKLKNKRRRALRTYARTHVRTHVSDASPRPGIVTTNSEGACVYRQFNPQSDTGVSYRVRCIYIYIKGKG